MRPMLQTHPISIDYGVLRACEHEAKGCLWSDVVWQLNFLGNSRIHHVLARKQQFRAFLVYLICVPYFMFFLYLILYLIGGK